MTEEWRDIPEWEGLYQVSSLGRIRSLPRWGHASRNGTPYVRFLKGALIKPSLDENGRPRVTLSKNSVKDSFCVCVLVAAAFIGQRPNGEQVRHWDGNPQNNTPDNLCYGTALENAADRTRHGRNTLNKGEDNPMRILQEIDIPVIRKLSRQLGLKDLAAIYRVGVSTIHDILMQRTWTHV